VIHALYGTPRQALSNQDIHQSRSFLPRHSSIGVIVLTVAIPTESISQNIVQGSREARRIYCALRSTSNVDGTCDVERILSKGIGFSDSTSSIGSRRGALGEIGLYLLHPLCTLALNYSL
jgi:hypothetical protein